MQHDLWLGLFYDKVPFIVPKGLCNELDARRKRALCCLSAAVEVLSAAKPGTRSYPKTPVHFRGCSEISDDIPKSLHGTLSLALYTAPQPETTPKNFNANSFVILHTLL